MVWIGAGVYRLGSSAEEPEIGYRLSPSVVRDQRPAPAIQVLKRFLYAGVGEHLRFDYLARAAAQGQTPGPQSSSRAQGARVSFSRWPTSRSAVRNPSSITG